MRQYPRYWKRHRRRYDLRKRVDLPVLLVVQVALLLAVVEGEAPLGQDLDDAGGLGVGQRAVAVAVAVLFEGEADHGGGVAPEEGGGGGGVGEARIPGADVVGDEGLGV